MMKRLGYRPELAAAVEAVASTGGQIMPPIMGAGAFVMAELIQVPYLQVAAAAFLPALLYFLAVGLGIHFYAGKARYTGMDEKSLPGWGETARASSFFMIPFSVLGFWLLNQYTPQYAAFWALLSTLPLGLFDTHWRLEPKSLWRKYRQAILSGARQASVIASICTCAQIIIAVIALTGVGVKFTNSILSLTSDNLFLALLLTGLTSLLLGMEVPTTAAYIVAVVVGGPVLAELGVPPLAAHLFVFYLAILSAVTPPVCGAVYIAAGMADANWVNTAKLGLKLSFAAFLLPFCFALDPSLILIGSLWQTALSFIRGILAILLISAGFIGYFRTYLNLASRLALLAGGVFFLLPDWRFDLAGACLGVLVWLINREAGPQGRPAVKDKSQA
jgi:TRAP transporter 4TM/12TM fusion protein